MIDISILYSGKRPPVGVAPQVFSDVRLDKLFSGETLDILSRPCSAQDIEYRQSIFAELKDLRNYELFGIACDSLYSLAASCRALETAQTPLEKLFLRIGQLRAGASATEALSKLNTKIPVLQNYIDYWKSIMRDMPAQLGHITELAHGISDFMLSDLGSMRLKEPSAEDSIQNLICKYANALGYDGLKVKYNEIKPDARISAAVAALFSDNFNELYDLVSGYSDIPLDKFADGRSEFSFYIDVMALICRAEKAGIPYCFPKIASTPKHIMREAYDISLLGSTVIPNDIEFDAESQFCFLTGANGGGKTTYLRAITINLILFTSGCPVFGKSAEIFPFSRISTHFPVDERFEGNGRLFDEKKRVSGMLEYADRNSFLCFNETFSGADLAVGCTLLRELTENIKTCGAFGLYVTHFHEVNELGLTVLNAVVDTSDGNRRTYKITHSSDIRSSFAADILKKYRLDRESLATKEADL